MPVASFSRVVLLAILLQASIPSLAQVERSSSPTPAEDTWISVPVNYPSTMLVLVSHDTIAGLRFKDPFEIGNQTNSGVIGVSYQCRYLAVDAQDSTEMNERGRVFSKLREGAVQHGTHEINIGSIQLRWKPRHKQQGVIEFQLGSLCVYPVSESLFSEQAPQAFPGGDPLRALDLRLFRREFTPSISADKERLAHSTIAVPAVYPNCTLIAVDAGGIAALEFESMRERQAADNEVHHLVPYKFTYWPRNRTAAIDGKGVVYERYVRGVYEGGELELVAGPMRFKWSRGGKDAGWVYVKSPQTKIWNITTTDSKKLIKWLESL